MQPGQRCGCRLCAGGPLALSAASWRRAAAERPADAAAAAGAALDARPPLRGAGGAVRLAVPGEPELNWRAFVEPESRAVLYLRALTSSATCAVFETDPIAKTGVVMTAASPSATSITRGPSACPWRTSIRPWPARRLTERHAHARPGHQPAAGAAPTTTDAVQFVYPAPSPDFSASNAYYHTDWMYRLVEGMGFNLATYFNGTAFPVPVDHAGMGNSVNAQAPGNAAGNGIGRFLYGLVSVRPDDGHRDAGGRLPARVRPRPPLGPRQLPNFGWCHSAGDTLAALMMDGLEGSKSGYPTASRPSPSSRPARASTAATTAASRPAGPGEAPAMTASTAASRSFRPRCSGSTA